MLAVNVNEEVSLRSFSATASLTSVFDIACSFGVAIGWVSLAVAGRQPHRLPVRLGSEGAVVGPVSCDMCGPG